MDGLTARESLGPEAGNVLVLRRAMLHQVSSAMVATKAAARGPIPSPN